MKFFSLLIRYKELQAEGKNAATHDFKPEWIEFWNKRMLELHQDEVKSNKTALRKRLGIEEPAPISFKIGERRKPQGSGNKPIPTAAQPDNDPEVKFELIYFELICIQVSNKVWNLENMF